MFHLMVLKNRPISVKCILYPKYIRGLIILRVARLYPTVVGTPREKVSEFLDHLLKTFDVVSLILC